MTTRWDLFRRLCRYYRDCLRFDEHDSLRFLENLRGQTWELLPAIHALRLGEVTAPVRRVVDGPDTEEAICELIEHRPTYAGILGTAQQHADWSSFVGYPLLTIKRGERRWTVPVLLIPVVISAQPDGIAMRRCGPILPNHAALEHIFTDSASRQACCERIGLVPAELGQATAEQRWDDALSVLVDRLQQEQVLPADSDFTQALWGVAKQGLYHRRLAEELHLLAEATPQEALDASALRFVFGGEQPQISQQISQQVSQQVSQTEEAGDEEEPLVWQHPLDPAQRRAVMTGLHADISQVTGPPGTGKSVMVRHVMVNMALRKRSVLLASRNHRAIDAVEPTLNKLSPGNELIVRTRNHGQTRSWKFGLLDLLDRSDSDLVDSEASERRWRQLLDHCRQLEGELALVTDLAERYHRSWTSWQEALRRVPATWRTRVATEEWSGPDEEAINTAITQWQRLENPDGLRRLLPPGHKQRLHSFRQQFQSWLNDDPLLPPDAPTPDNHDRYEECFTALRAAAQARQCSQVFNEAQRQLDRLGIDRDQLLGDLARSHGRCWQAGIDHLSDRAIAPSPDAEEKAQLANLRAAVANFGIDRWQTVYREHFPLLLKRRPLWTCTNLSVPATLPRTGGLFDLVIIDEACQCDIPSIIPLLFRAKRLMIVGDPQQLGHISRLSALQDERLLASHELTSLDCQRFGYRSTNAYRLIRDTPGIGQPLLLSEHYRCHPQIAAIFNRAFYRQRLHIRTNTDRLPASHRWSCGCHWHDIDTPLVRTNHGACAPAEADRAAELVRDLQETAYEGTIGVVTPFRQQVIMLTKRIEAATDEAFRNRTRLSVATAHGFQGDERDCLIFSLCAGDNLGAGAARFLAATPNLFNVAISRARAALHIVGNRRWARHADLECFRILAVNGADDQDPAAALVPESPGEKALLEALRETGIEALPQYAASGRRLDLAVIEGHHHLAIEIDGIGYHATADGSSYDDDCWRDLILQEQGWQILRFWHHEVRDHLGDCVARVHTALGH